MGIKGTQLANEIANSLREYTSEVEKNLDELKSEVSKEAAEELKSSSPVGATGKYAKGWTVSKIGTNLVIHNKTDYQLTHLLENTHALRNGGRSKPLPHIGPVHDKAIEKFEREVEKRLRQ